MIITVGTAIWWFTSDYSLAENIIILIAPLMKCTRWEGIGIRGLELMQLAGSLVPRLCMPPDYFWVRGREEALGTNNWLVLERKV